MVWCLVHHEVIYPYEAHLPDLSHVLKFSVIHAAGAVCLLRHLIEIVADAAQVSAHFPQGGIVHLQDISVNRHFPDIGFPVVRMDFLHPFMNHVKLFRGDAHQNPDFLFVLLFHGQIICSFFRAGI